MYCAGQELGAHGRSHARVRTCPGACLHVIPRVRRGVAGVAHTVAQDFDASLVAPGCAEQVLVYAVLLLLWKAIWSYQHRCTPENTTVFPCFRTTVVFSVYVIDMGSTGSRGSTCQWGLPVYTRHLNSDARYADLPLRVVGCPRQHREVWLCDSVCIRLVRQGPRGAPADCLCHFKYNKETIPAVSREREDGVR